MANGSIGRNWCFTLNNPTAQEVAQVHTWEGSAASYIVYGRECVSTPHLQGYVQFRVNVRGSGVKKMLERAHWEVAKGTPEENKAYCSKEGSVYEAGVIRSTVKRNVKGGEGNAARFEEALQLAKEGRIDEISADIQVRSYRAFKDIQRDHMPRGEALGGPCGVWVTGPSGCGKSSWARHETGVVYDKMGNKWWDGYQQEEVVILDDYEPLLHLGHHLKIWADEYPFIGETKGGAVRMRPRLLVITSQYTIEESFEDAKTVEALKRRFHIVDMNILSNRPSWTVPLTDVFRAHYVMETLTSVRANIEERWRKGLKSPAPAEELEEVTVEKL